jgi:hypothetical protein
MEVKIHLKTLKVRVKDKHQSILERMAFEVNQVWNQANEITADFSCVPIPGVGYIRNHWTAYDLQKLLKTIKQERGFIIHSTTVQEVIAAHYKACKQFKTDKLRWRISGGSRRSLGWIPFKKGAAKWNMGRCTLQATASKYGTATDCQRLRSGLALSRKMRAGAGISISCKSTEI